MTTLQKDIRAVQQSRSAVEQHPGQKRLRGGLLVLLVGLLGACAQTTTTVQQRLPDQFGTSNDRRSNSSTPSYDDADVARRAQVRLELAAAYFSRGQLNTALEEVKLALAAKPDLAPAYNLRGLIYGGLGDMALAEENFRRALQLDARDADIMHNYGWFLCQQQQRYADADALFRQALASPQYRDTTRTLLAQGVCQARGGQLALAETTLQRAYELDAGNPAVAVNLSEVLYRRGEYERARFLMRRVNGSQDLSNAQTLWLAVRIENRLRNNQGLMALGNQLRDRFPQAPETRLFERRQFDE